jgi:hypothetical protein
MLSLQERRIGTLSAAATDQARGGKTGLRREVQLGCLL